MIKLLNNDHIINIAGGLGCICSMDRMYSVSSEGSRSNTPNQEVCYQRCCSYGKNWMYGVHEGSMNDDVQRVAITWNNCRQRQRTIPRVSHVTGSLFD